MSEDYKSLEHIIRNIQNKVEETTKENKSLEHTIREIQEGYISVGKKTSKFEGLSKSSIYGDRTQPIHQHAVQPKHPKGNDALEKAKEAISSHDWAGDFKAAQERIAKDKEEFAKSGKKLMIHREESSFADRSTRPIDEKKKKVDEEEPRLNSEMNVNVSGRGKFQGNEFASIPVRGHMGHVKPDSHSDKAETAGMARKMAKEKLGKNRVAEETQQLDEILPAAIAAAPYVGPALAAGAAGIGAYMAKKPIEDMLKSGKKGAETLSSKIDKIINPAPEELQRAQKAIQPKSVAPTAVKERPIGPPMPEVQAEPEKKKKEEVPTAPPTKVAEPTKAPEAPIAKPTETPKAAEKPAEVVSPPKTGVGAKAETPAKVADIAVPAKPATIPAPTKPVEIPAAVTPKISTPAVPATAATPATVAATGTTVTPGQSKPNINFGLPSSVPHEIDYKVAHRVPIKVQTHFAKKHKMHEAVDGGVERKKIQNVPRPDAGDRHDNELVGRKDADPKTAKEKTSRQGEYRTKVIDEAKQLAAIVKSIAKSKKEEKQSGGGKTKVFPQVIINPDLKHNTMDGDDVKMPNDHK